MQTKESLQAMADWASDFYRAYCVLVNGECDLDHTMDIAYRLHPRLGHLTPDDAAAQFHGGDLDAALARGK